MTEIVYERDIYLAELSDREAEIQWQKGWKFVVYWRGMLCPHFAGKTGADRIELCAAPSRGQADPEAGACSTRTIDRFAGSRFADPPSRASAVSFTNYTASEFADL